ncbi:hypothetical protein BCU84_04600 [Shewanella sp. 10N.286.51.B7]|uniref:multiheme c-type cytochrome n=1 Tax=Shewanella sp. 10N.286.51.B7 TaxID=1880836 RepID=UPI000C863764|nr:hypothetical protein [Shewanella sp. 10N.286.51.B7]PMG80023.1 hypothetical protein BCU84_04600 [Shewanella sp. 10N.286.51.B7]
MKNLTKCRLAFVVAAAMGIAGCGSDGKDGEDGAPGEPGPGPTPPVVEASEVTNVEFISHMVEEGQVTLEFEITDEEGLLINGLENAAVYLAAKTEDGIQRSRDGSVGGSASASDEGATLTMLDDGRYEFVAPMAAVQADTEGLIRLQVGGGDSIASSPYIIVNKPEMTHTTTTETCYSCHVDYATSDIKHSGYVALNTDGEVDFVGGCMVCHNNVARDVDSEGNSLDTGGYAKNTMQKLGHINHQKFEKDFTPTNCYTCHAEPVINTSIAGNGCSDCHTTDSASAQFIMANSDFDAREFHVKSEKIGIDERQVIRAEHSTTLSAVYKNDTGAYCTDLSLFKGEEQLSIETLYADGTLTYASTYLHGYHNESIVGRESRSYEESYNSDGSKTFCHSTLDLQTPQIMASSRVTFNHGEDASYDGVSFTSYSPVAELADLNVVSDYDRRHAVTTDSCTTCHNNETNYHKNGSYVEGGLDCVACHNNGQDRNAVGSAPGFGPMVHSMHWGIGNELSGAKQDEDGNNVPNSADSLNADNCVSCHAEGIDLSAIPNQYMRAKAFNTDENGDPDTTKMASPITANCFACHDSASALSHMEQNGGEIDAEVVTDWYTQPTAESCATCHDTGKSFGIDKFHNFER